MRIMRFLFLLVFTITLSCHAQENVALKVGAECADSYMPLLINKRVAVVVNQSSLIKKQHLVDVLLKHNINIQTIFSPEHGFRGKADAGEKLNNSVDSKTGIPIVSLYGKNKKPTVKQLNNIDIVIYDLQDVGIRFYTYISTMHYVMEACAEQHIPFVILDRPNPNGDYFDGPILQAKFKSFVGMDPIPIVYGLTAGELASMINGEGWLNNGIRCNLTVIKMQGWNHNSKYHLPVKPSPNLPNYQAVRLYPSLCLFEPTQISVGRGTYSPFQIIGYPHSPVGDYSFIPKSIVGMSKYPKHQNEKCMGLDLRNKPINKYHFTLKFLINFYNSYPDKTKFVTNKRMFNLLAGNDKLIKQLESHKSEEEIRATWNNDLKHYSHLRDKYLLYQKEK